MVWRGVCRHSKDDSVVLVRVGAGVVVYTQPVLSAVGGAVGLSSGWFNNAEFFARPERKEYVACSFPVLWLDSNYH